MPRDKLNDFIPIKFNFNTQAADDRFYIYSIRNRLKDKIYIGISGHPQRRINEQLQFKAELCDDYAQYARSDEQKPEPDRVFEFALINETGYPSALLGCTAEILNILELENNKIAVYNRNKFGGHPALNNARQAFDAIVMIADPAINTYPNENQMACLEKYMPEITAHVEETQGNDIINEAFLEKLYAAWDDFMEIKRNNGFGRSVISLDKITLKNYKPLQRINDKRFDDDAQEEENEHATPS